MSHPDLSGEQAYVDRAYAFLERMREIVARAGDSADGEVAQAALDAWAARRLQTYEDAERGLVFGRLDFESVDRPLYVGRRWVHDEEQQQVVVNWQAPAARPYYTATPVDPQRVTLRRRFKTEGRALLDLADERLGGSDEDAPAAVDEFLLDELERTRTARMRDIVATIQADQYRLITRDLDGVLVIQGGPGTGKTAVALHRASWLLFTFRDRLRSGVLVVGPNPVFMKYVSHVLPALGEESVVQRAVTELVDGVTAARADPPEVAALKGGEEMADLLRRALESRLVPPDAELGAILEGTYVRVRADEVAELVRETWTESGSLAPGRDRLRMKLLRRFYERYGRVLGGLATRSFDEVERALRTKGYLQRFLGAAWPNVSLDELVRAALAEAGL